MLSAQVEQIAPNIAAPLVHVISDAGPHPYFRTLIESGGIDRQSVVVGCVGPDGALNDDMRALGVETFALGARGRAHYPAATLRLARMLRRLRAPVVQTHLIDGSLVGLTAARMAAVKVAVFTAHHSHELPYHGRKVLWPDRLCAGPLSDHTIAPTRQVAETLVQYTGIDARKIEVVHHGFDLSALNPADADGHAVRAELGLEGKLVLGAIGRLYELKNYGALIEAFAATAATIAEARLLIVGGGDASPLVKLADRLGISDRVVFAGPRNDIPAVLAAFDAFVHPAVTESFGMVIIEAMAMAKPVLCTPVGIAPEVIEDGTTGLLTSGTGMTELAAGLRRLLEARPDWPRLGASAHVRVSGFTATAMAGRYQELYAEWVSSSRRTRRAGRK